MNKKADLTGVIFLVVSIAIFAIFLLIVGYTIPVITDSVKDRIGIDADINNSLDASANVARNTLPTLWLIMFGGLMLGLFATSYFIPTHPIFVPIFIFLLVISIVIAIPISNAYEELSKNTLLSEAAAEQGLIGFLMINLPYIAFIVGLISLVITFAKPDGGNQVALG